MGWDASDHVLLIGIWPLKVKEGHKLIKKSNGHYPSDDNPEWAGRLSENAKGTPTYAEKIAERTKLRRINKSKERFVRLGEDLTGSPAWKALDVYARDAYAWLQRRYWTKDGNTNNGNIPMSARELAESMGVNKDTATRALLRLRAVGIIAVEQRGRWGGHHARRATRYRLTEYRSADGRPPTRDYLTLGWVEASQRARQIAKRDSGRGHPKRKKLARPMSSDVTSEGVGHTRPKTSEPAPISVYKNKGFTSEHVGQSIALPGEGAAKAASQAQPADAPQAAGRPSWKEKLAAREKQRKREIAKLARKFQ